MWFKKKSMEQNGAEIGIGSLFVSVLGTLVGDFFFFFGWGDKMNKFYLFF